MRSTQYMASQPTIFVVDDDSGVRDFVGLLLELSGYSRIRTYESSRRFLHDAALRDGDCVLLDLHMPDLDGLAVQKELSRCGRRVSVIVITGHADVPIAVKAIRAGAVDFIEKPFSNDALISSVRRALAADEKLELGLTKSADTLRRLETLTRREREVFDRIVQGATSMGVAHDLNVSKRTVEMHRARVMEKMQAQNVAALIRMTFDVGKRSGQRQALQPIRATRSLPY